MRKIVIFFLVIGMLVMYSFSNALANQNYKEGSKYQFIAKKENLQSENLLKGNINKQEFMSHVNKAIDRKDKNNDGKITMNEIDKKQLNKRNIKRKSMGILKGGLTPEKASHIFDRADKNNDGIVSENEMTDELKFIIIIIIIPSPF